jgi:hypothetical protein
MLSTWCCVPLPAQGYDFCPINDGLWGEEYEKGMDNFIQMEQELEAQVGRRVLRFRMADRFPVGEQCSIRPQVAAHHTSQTLAPAVNCSRWLQVGNLRFTIHRVPC